MISIWKAEFAIYYFLLKTTLTFFQQFSYSNLNFKIKTFFYTNLLRLDARPVNADAASFNMNQFSQQVVQAAPQQEELQTVTHKKVVVRTIQTRDGQVI